MGASLLLTTRLHLASHLEQHGKHPENRREKCTDPHLVLDIVTATVTRAHMSRLHAVLPWLDLLRKLLVLHRQPLLHQLRIKGSKQ